MADQIPVTGSLGDLDSVQQQADGKSSTRAMRPRRPERLPSLAFPDLSREEAIRRLMAFEYLARMIAESNHNVDRIAQGAAHLTADAMGDMSVITLLNAHSETYHIAAYHDPDPDVVALFKRIEEEVANIPRDQGWVAKVIATGEPLLMPEISVEEASTAAVSSFVQFSRRVGIASMLIVPITGMSGTLGTIALTRHRRGRPYDQAQQIFLMEIGRRVGWGIENAIVVESLRKEVAARRFAKEALAASEERFLSIFRATSLGVTVMDLVGTMLESNSAFQATTGYDQDELIAMHFYDMVYSADVAQVLRAFKRVKTGREPQARMEHRLCRKDGSMVWVRTTFTGVRKAAEDPTLTLIFGIVEDITERKQADSDLLELKQHLQRSIEMERLRLAQSLHDTPLQELYAVIYRLEELRPTTRPATAETLGKVIDEIKATLEGLRSIASELRPPALSRFGLEKAIRSYVEDFRQKYPHLRLNLSLAHDRQLLSEDVRLALFRVFQEAMANIARHAHASQVQVRFSFDAEEARLEVSDDGYGFVVPPNWMTEVREGHYGLAGMAERVSAASGVLTLESRPEGPTTVRAVIPCVSN